MTASLHKLSAGDGYTYLTRSVAALDGTLEGRTSLADYYDAKGEAPGRWMGKGLDGLQHTHVVDGARVGGRVTEDQMRALFGSGRHPDADQIERKVISNGGSAATALEASKLGRVFRDGQGSTEFHQRCAIAMRDWNAGQGRPSRAEIPDDVKAEIRTRVGLDTFIEAHGRAPLTRSELDGHVKSQMRRNQACAGYDISFSPVKSVSVLWAVADADLANQIAACHDDAVAEAMSWLESEMTYTRQGRNGVRSVEVRGLIAATFVHRDSRAGDPDLHTHVAVSNKVQALNNGSWMALDGRLVYQSLVTVSERYNSALERLLNERIGVRFGEREARADRRPIREIVGVSAELCDRWSSRRRDIEVVKHDLVARFEAAHGRPPTPVEEIALAQQATLETRPDKHEPRSLAEQRATWRGEALDVLGGAGELTRMLDMATGHRVNAGELSPEALTELAGSVLDTVENNRATFALTNVIAEAERQLRTVGVAPASYQATLDQVVDLAIAESLPRGAQVDTVQVPDDLRRSDGSSVYERPNGQLYTTQRIVDAEGFVVRAGSWTGGRVATGSSIELAIMESAANGLQLDASQRRMVRQFTSSGRRVQLALAPAGSGKTTAMAVLARAWQADGGDVVAVAPTHLGATGLRQAMDCDGGTLAAITHALTTDGPLPEWAARVGSGTLMVVDEAGMASTVDLAMTLAWAVERGASVRLIGDDRQLAAIAAGGVLRDLATTDPDLVTLTELHRFRSVAEGQATLALRDGDAAAIGYYLDNGRVHTVAADTGAEQLLGAWAADIDAGLSSLMLAGTRAEVTQLNTLARQHRISTGQIVVGAQVELRDGNLATTGDIIVSRHNDRRLVSSARDWVKNRDRWVVVEVADDGSIEAANLLNQQRVRMPADYVQEHVELGYASTVHGAQGATVDTSHTLIDGAETRPMLYVALSRGRQSNHVWVAASVDEHGQVWQETSEPRTATEILEAIMKRDGTAVSATTTEALANDPIAAFSYSAALWQDAATMAIVRSTGRGREALEKRIAQAPAIAEDPGWPAAAIQLLRAQLVDGRDASGLLNELLDDGVDSAAAIIERVTQPTSEGDLRWLITVPAAARKDPQWDTYLDQRAAQLTERAQAVRDLVDQWDIESAPVWARPWLHAPALLTELVLWRAAYEIPDTEQMAAGAPTGNPVDDLVWRDLTRRATEYRAVRYEMPVWNVPAAVVDDPYWQVVAPRLAEHDTNGVDVAALIDSNLERPLPAEHPAAALWYRLLPGLPELATSRNSPAWVAQLRGVLPAGATKAPGFAELISALDEARRRGLDPAGLIADPIAAGAQLGLPVDQLVPMLVTRVRDDLDEPTTQLAPTEPEPVTEPKVVVDDVRPDPELGDTPKDRIEELTAAAAEFYKTNYAGSGAARYITGRFGTDLTDMPDLVVGYAPGGGRALVDHLRSVGATDTELVDAGLARWSRYGQLQDLFRDRILVGLHNEDGKLAGFTGRAAPGADERTPKYINTPTTRAYHKGTTMFGIVESGQALAQGAVAARCEGVFDAIAVTRAGGGEVVGVAPLGTALTQAQVDQLAGRTKRVLEAVDQDSAGQAAARKDFEKLAAAGLEAGQLTLIAPPGDERPVKDPAELYARDRGVTLSGVLAAHQAAPSLASRLLGDLVWSNADRDLTNMNVAVGMCRQAAGIITPLPPDQWDDHITLTVDLMAASYRGADVDGWRASMREILAENTHTSSAAWAPIAPRSPQPQQARETQAHETLQRLVRERRSPAPAPLPPRTRDGQDRTR